MEQVDTRHGLAELATGSKQTVAGSASAEELLDNGRLKGTVVPCYDEHSYYEIRFTTNTFG